MGLSLARALGEAGASITLLGRKAQPVGFGLTLRTADWAEHLAASSIVLLAVPDKAIEDVASRLADEQAVTPGHCVLHLSGLRDRTALAPLAGRAGGLGSFHPLQAVADPAVATRATFYRTPVALEGDEPARAAGRQLAELLEMHPVRIPDGAKPAYHAAATIASNYTVVLTAMAERLVAEAGVDEFRNIFGRLLSGTVSNLNRLPPYRALTGPIRRGDAATVAAHLASLDPESAELYRQLGRRALDLALTDGLDGQLAAEVAAVLDSGPDGPSS